MLFKNIKIVDEKFEIRKDMFVRTEGEFITYIGEVPPEEIAGEEIYRGEGRLLIPGLFDTHCHIPMTLMRGYGEGLPLSRWLNEKIFPFEACLTAEDVYWSTKLGAMELLSSGTVSITDMYFFIEDMALSLDECGMKANICHGISSFDESVHLRDLQGYKDTMALAGRVKSGEFGGRIKADMGLHAEYTSYESLVREVADAAREEGLRVHVHVSETKSEHEECKGRHGGRTPARYLYDAGLFDSPATVAHGVYLEDEDAELLREKAATVVHNPSSNMKLASGFLPLKRFLDMGLKVALGTDGASSNNNLNMMEEMHLMALIARGYAGDANAVSPAGILKIASYNGAISQGRTDSGLIAVGKRADLAVVDISRPHMRPDFDTLANLVFAAQSSDILLTMVDGRVVYKDGDFPYIDGERVIYEAERSFRRILKTV